MSFGSKFRVNSKNCGNKHKTWAIFVFQLINWYEHQGGSGLESF